MEKINTVEDYILQFPVSTQQVLHQFRALIKKTAPEAVESISYAMPAYKLYGQPLVYFAAYAQHIGFYATPTGHSAFANDLSKYKQGKGSVQFPLDQPMPWELIHQMIAFRVAENAAKKNKKIIS